MEAAKQSGDKAFGRQDYEEAKIHYKEALTMPPPATEIRQKIHANLSAAHAQLKEADKAVDQARKALNVDPEFAPGHLRLGNAYELKGQFSQAMGAYEKGASIDPQNEKIQRAIANLKKHLADSEAGNKQRAAATSAAAAKQDQVKNSECTRLREEGNDFFRKQDYNKAIDKYTQAIAAGERESEKPELYHTIFSNRALCYNRTKNYEASLADAERCVELKSDFVKGHVHRGDALKNLGRHEEARKAYLAGLKLDPQMENLQAAVRAEDVVLGKGNTQGAHAGSGDPFEPEADEDKDSLYQILGLTREATTEEITRAARKLSARWHPDKNPGDVEAQEKMIEINYAKDVLTNEIKRRAYDKHGKHGLTIIDTYGEEMYVEMEKYEPYVPCIMCCLCLFAIPTLCCCCCCCCCCCGVFAPKEQEMDPDAWKADEDDEEGGHFAPDSYGPDLEAPGAPEM